MPNTFSPSGDGGLNQLTLEFLKKLKKNNNRPWFEKTRNAYEAAKADYLQFATLLLAELAKQNPELEQQEAKKCIYRINRDVRFSKDKSPYKTNMGMGISKAGKNLTSAGYYIHCEPGQCFVAAGLYFPMPPALNKVRQEIDYNLTDFKKIITDKKFKALFTDLDRSEGFELKRPPKGYEAENPAIEYLKFKSFIVTVKIPDETFTDKKLVKTIADICKTAKPFIDFINSAIE